MKTPSLIIYPFRQRQRQNRLVFVEIDLKNTPIYIICAFLFQKIETLRHYAVEKYINALKYLKRNVLRVI